jgi:hypothetical protein
VASKRRLWNRFGRIFSGLVVACFFLPFFGISCQHLDVVTISGTDMVGGCRPGGLLTAEAERKSARHPERADAGEMTTKVENVKVEPLAIAAFACAVIAFVLAWRRTRQALLGACAVSIVGIGLLIAVYVKVGGDIRDEIAKTKDTAMVKKDEVSSGSRYGLWLTAMGLLTIATITGMGLREPEPVAPPPPAAPA